MSAFRKLAAAFVLLTFPLGAAAPASAQDAGDPPDNVARIAEISGTVSFHPAGSQDWQSASANYPVTAGSELWAEPRSHAAVDVNGARIHLDGASDLEITSIDPQSAQLSVPQGAVFVHVYPGATGQSYEIDTPRGGARIAQPGQYEIEAGDDQHPMTLTVFEGAAQLVGQSANMTLQQGQRGLINPDNSSSTAAAQPDDFVHMVQTEEQAYANTQQTAQYVSPAEPGYQDLARYGQWQTAPQYGAVWYPTQVAADWAPYRYGHWAYVAPWGYTWVDDAPWGFTPFHYGRWVQVGNRWGWVPGERVARPVYAPALVTFFGNLGGVGIDLSVGWVPLAPEEVYVPPYRHSSRYVHDINIVNVHNETKIVKVVNNVTVINYNNYANRRAATVVDRQTLAGARPVAVAFRNQPKGNDPQRWSQARPVAQVAVTPQAVNRPGNAPRFGQHQTSNAQFAAKADQNRPKNANGNSKYVAQPQNNQGKSKYNGQFAAQPQNNQPQTNQGKPKYNGQFAAQPQNNQAKPTGKKNAAPGPVIAPKATGTANGNGKPQWQGQQKNNQKNVQKPKNNNGTPGPVIWPQNAPGNPPQPQGQNQGQSGQPKSQSQAQTRQKTWKNGQAPSPTAAAAGAPTWKQENQRNNQQENASRNAQPKLQPMTSQPKAQPVPQFSAPAAKQTGKPNSQPWQQNGGAKAQSKQSRQQQMPLIQGQGKQQAKQQTQSKPQQGPSKSQNQGCNPKATACTRQ